MKFKDKATGEVFTMVNVHLKSQSTRGKDNKEEAKAYNNAKRTRQIQYLNALAKNVDGTVFILGDYNHKDSPKNTTSPMIGLSKGYSYDNMKSNLDFIGYTGISKSCISAAKETESKVTRCSTKSSEHPDHDIISVTIK